MKIALLGAPASGKTRLQRELAQHLPEAIQVSDDPPLAMVRRRGFDLILLMGLDLPGCRTASHHDTDAGLRHGLDQAGLPYGVVYGLGPQRLRAALQLVDPQQGPPPRWSGVCEKCADPDCELRTLLPRI